MHSLIEVVGLGNDFTHYERRHNDREIPDLERFIEATVHWVSMAMITAEAIEFTES